jgi:hypothetical protein
LRGKQPSKNTGICHLEQTSAESKESDRKWSGGPGMTRPRPCGSKPNGISSRNCGERSSEKHHTRHCGRIGDWRTQLLQLCDWHVGIDLPRRNNGQFDLIVWMCQMTEIVLLLSHEPCLP